MNKKYTVWEVYENENINTIYSNMFNSFSNILTIEDISGKLYQMFVCDFSRHYYFNNIDDENVAYSYNKLKFIVDSFCIQYEKNIKKIFDLPDLEYNPVENYNSTEEQIETPDIQNSVNNSVNGNDIITSENLTTTYEDLSFHNKDKNITTQQIAGRQSTQNTTGTNTITITKKGNIGVTTTQQMLQSEIELQKIFNPYKWLLKEISERILLWCYDYEEDIIQ